MRILIANEHTLLRRGLTLVLKQLYPSAELMEAQNAEQALEIIQSAGPVDFFLFDSTMKSVNGVAGVKRFVNAQANAPVVLISPDAETDNILLCVEAGVRGYISNAVDEETLVHAFAIMAAGEVFLPATIMQIIARPDRHAGPDRLEAISCDNPLRLLTRRQLDTLELLIDGLSNKEIARNLGILESTVKAHINAIMKKLNAQNRTQAAVLAAQLGWRQRNLGTH